MTIGRGKSRQNHHHLCRLWIMFLNPGKPSHERNPETRIRIRNRLLREAPYHALGVIHYYPRAAG